MKKQTQTLLAVGAVAVVGYLLFMKRKGNEAKANANGKMALPLGAPQGGSISVNPPFNIGRAPAAKIRMPLGAPQGGEFSVRPSIRMGRPLGFAD